MRYYKYYRYSSPLDLTEFANFFYGQLSTKFKTFIF